MLCWLGGVVRCWICADDGFQFSYFGKQEGDFSVVLKSLSARKTVKGDEQRKAVGRLQGSMTDAAIQQSVKGRGTGF